MSDLNEIIETTRFILERINPEMDCAWTRFDNAFQLKEEISKELLELENGDLNYLLPVYSQIFQLLPFKRCTLTRNGKKNT